MKFLQTGYFYSEVVTEHPNEAMYIYSPTPHREVVGQCMVVMMS